MVPNEIDLFPKRFENSREGRKRTRKADPNTWKRVKNSKLRMLGQEYTGFKKTENKYTQNELKSAIILGEGCNSINCLLSKVVYCEKLTESKRRQIFEEF